MVFLVQIRCEIVMRLKELERRLIFCVKLCDDAEPELPASFPSTN